MSVFHHHHPENPQKNNLRIIFWVLIIAYTVILPDVIIMYNAIATLIGTLTLIGLKSKPSGDWAWTGCIKTLKGFVALILFGAAGGVFMCVSLFDVKANRMFWGNYPIWLLIWNGLYLGLAPFVALFYRNRISKIARVPANGRGVKQKADPVTAVLWVLLPAAILFVLHALVFFVALSGKNFS